MKRKRRPEDEFLGEDLFDGETYTAERDESRLFKQLRVVCKYMSDGRWHTLAEIENATGYPQASISARLRDFRKPRWGAHIVERRYLSQGLHQYRLKGI